MADNADTTYTTFVCISHADLAGLCERTISKFKTPTKRVLFEGASKLIPHVQCPHGKGDCSQCNAIFERIVSIPHIIQTNPLPPPNVIIKDGPYSYTAGEWYVIFANKYLGGGYLNHGFVQEEIACFEFPEMATLLANYNNRGQLGAKEVALYSNLFRTCEVSVYGREFNNYSSRDLKKIVHCVKNKGPCNFLALDAVNISRKLGGASPNDNMYMLNKAIVGFQILRGRGVMNINTGKWGCGAFGNRVSDIFMITYLAAWYAGINVTFHLYDGLNRFEIEEILASNPSIADLQRALNISQTTRKN